MKREFRILAVVYAIVFLIGCAGWQLGGPDDPIELKQDKAYMVALKEFTLTLQDYNRHYAMADEATQAKWKAKYDPIFREASGALDDWEEALDKNWDPTTTEQIYLKLKAKVLALMLDVAK